MIYFMLFSVQCLTFEAHFLFLFSFLISRKYFDPKKNHHHLLFQKYVSGHVTQLSPLLFSLQWHVSRQIFFFPPLIIPAIRTKYSSTLAEITNWKHAFGHAPLLPTQKVLRFDVLLSPDITRSFICIKMEWNSRHKSGRKQNMNKTNMSNKGSWVIFEFRYDTDINKNYLPLCFSKWFHKVCWINKMHKKNIYLYISADDSTMLNQ